MVLQLVPQVVGVDVAPALSSAGLGGLDQPSNLGSMLEHHEGVQDHLPRRGLARRADALVGVAL